MSEPTKLNIRVANKINLTPEIEAVLRAMFSDFSQVVIEAEFGRGLSGSRVFRVRLIERGGRTLLPTVIKIAPSDLIRWEWRAYQAWVEQTLPNIARMESPPIFPTTDAAWGGLRYALVGGGTFAVQSLRDYFQEAEVNDLCWTLENRLFEILGQSWWLDKRTHRAFQMQADYDALLPVNVLLKFTPPLKEDFKSIQPHDIPPILPFVVGDEIQLKDFVVIKVDQKRRQLTLNIPPAAPGQPLASYRIRVDDVPDIARYRMDDIIASMHGVVIATRHDLLTHQVRQALGESVNLSTQRLTLPTGVSLPNPLLSYQELLLDFLTVNMATIHGDLNLENILVDPATREVSVIDFATVRPGHALHDLLRLETEVLITLLPSVLAGNGLTLEILFPLYERLDQITPHLDHLVPPNLPHAALEKPFAMLRVIRKMARKCLFDLEDWQEYYRGLVLYLLGVLKFDVLDTLPTAPLPKQVAFWAAAVGQYFLERPSLPPIQQPTSIGASLPREQQLPAEIESPFGTMHPDSRFYIERAADEICWEQMSSPYATTLFVQAPMQTGKSSLLRRGLHLARQKHQKQVAFIDFQKFTERYFVDEESFFIQLCVMIGDALGVPEAIDQYWAGRRTNIIKCSLYISHYIIPKLNGSFILAMDEVEQMQRSPFRAGFFGMLRTWHNERAFDANFARMTLFLSSSTDPFLLIDNPHQSPFNVAIPISLHDFTQGEVSELNRRHHSPLNEAQIKELMSLVDGHPFLTRLALYQLALGKIDLPTLLTQAVDDNGPFGDHLRHYLLKVWQKPELKQALSLISQKHTHAENDLFYRLKEAGLIKKAGQQVVFRNSLYERYFKERLHG